MRVKQSERVWSGDDSEKRNNGNDRGLQQSPPPVILSHTLGPAHRTRSAKMPAAVYGDRPSVARPRRARLPVNQKRVRALRDLELISI